MFQTLVDTVSPGDVPAEDRMLAQTISAFDSKNHLRLAVHVCHQPIPYHPIGVVQTYGFLGDAPRATTIGRF
jgi:hypothetical protein